MTSTVLCNNCSGQSSTEIYQYVNACTQPELKEKILSGELFLWTCPKCGAKKLLTYPLLYRDTNQKIIICLSAAPLSVANPEGWTGRIVGEPGELIEKIKIFDAGLDDMAIEMTKFVTEAESGKEMKLKFLRLDESEGALIFTYPEAGEMQLLSVGLGVYENCLAALQRNPGIREAAEGQLARIDKAWMYSISR